MKAVLFVAVLALLAFGTTDTLPTAVAWADDAPILDPNVVDAIQVTLQRAAAHHQDVIARIAADTRTATHPGTYPTLFAAEDIFMGVNDTTAHSWRSTRSSC